MAAKVSICIPTYCQIEFLRKTLNSILKQNFSDYELIISDDTPDDSIKNLLDEFDFGKKLRYFHNNPSLGTPANWNFAVEQAKGEYIKLLHHDDFFTSPKSLEKYVNLLDKNPKAYFAFSATEVWSLASNLKHKHTCSPKHFNRIKREPDFLFFGNQIGSPSATIYRKTSNIIYDENLKWLVDVDFYVQMLHENSNIVFCSEALICTIDGGEGQVTHSVMKDKKIQVQEHIYLFNKLFKRKINLKKYSLFFQLLFDKFEINSLDEINSIYSVPKELENFFIEVLELKKKNILLKKILYWTRKTKPQEYLYLLKKYSK